MACDVDSLMLEVIPYALNPCDLVFHGIPVFQVSKIIGLTRSDWNVCLLRLVELPFAVVVDGFIIEPAYKNSENPWPNVI